MPRMHCVPVVLPAGNYLLEIDIDADLYLALSQRLRGDIPLLRTNQLRYLLYRNTDTIWSAPVPRCNSRSLSANSDSDKPSKAT
jgi:hypothetical protein